jgi:tRNA (mo5U34)-methyltransferase
MSDADGPPWFHNVHLADGSQTRPDHPMGDFPNWKWQEITSALPVDLSGMSCLDVGCNGGFYSFALARRGAEVLGIDHDPHYLEQARWARERVEGGQRVRLEQMGVYDLARLHETFDLVLFMGVFYHLRYPLLALDLVAEKVRQRLVFQTLVMPGDAVLDAAREDRGLNERELMLEAGWPKMAFIEDRLANDPTNWWAANHAAVQAMLRSTGMQIDQRIGDETYLCSPGGPAGQLERGWGGGELESATGRGGRVQGQCH